MHKRYMGPALAATVATLAACANGPTSTVGARSMDATRATGATKSYILLSSGASLPSDLATRVASIGGALVSSTPQIGMAVATSDDPGFAGNALKIKGVGFAGENPTIQLDPTERVVDAGAEIDGPTPQANPIGSTESFWLARWAPDAVNAPAAWAAGQLGAGARVAILDSGIDPTHIDLAAHFDVAHSKSFIAGFNFDLDVGTFWHGMHVAGIIGAPENSIGIIGIAPEATLIGVKVLHGGSGPWSGVIDAIIYAATPIASGGAGAHIINLSLGGAFYRQGKDAALLAAAIGRATTYASQQGALVVAAAGNSAFDLDHTANIVFFPAQAANVVSVSATGPMGWATGAPFDLDRPASYTNYGQSAITFAGPGGDFALPGTDICTKPRLPSGTLTNYCSVFDMVMAPTSKSGSVNYYAWAAGTSMAAPAVSGVAALIVGKYGPMSPQQLRARLQQSADDLGRPGNDDFYGGGRVNALRAIQ